MIARRRTLLIPGLHRCKSDRGLIIRELSCSWNNCLLNIMLLKSVSPFKKDTMDQTFSLRTDLMVIDWWTSFLIRFQPELKQPNNSYLRILNLILAATNTLFLLISLQSVKMIWQFCQNHSPSYQVALDPWCWSIRSQPLCTSWMFSPCVLMKQIKSTIGSINSEHAAAETDSLNLLFSTLKILTMMLMSAGLLLGKSSRWFRLKWRGPRISAEMIKHLLLIHILERYSISMIPYLLMTQTQST